jgi:hypothetical protein
MADHEQPKRPAQAHENEAFFDFRVIWVIDQPRTFIEKDRSGLLERDAVLALVGCSLAIIPLKVKRPHVEPV